MFKLTRAETAAEDVINNRHQWPVQYTAVYSADDTPAKIFVMQESPDTDVFADSFSCVANAIQMTDLPADAAEEGSPFYRVGSITHLCRSALAAEEFVEKVEWAVQDLADNLGAAASLAVADETVIEPSS